MKIAIIHEWLVTTAGSERVLEQMISLFPGADIFCLVDFLPEAERGIVQKKEVRTSFLQSLPFAGKRYRNYLPLFPIAVERFNLSGYDLILSSSHAVAKGVKTHKEQINICYCHTPMRYAWDLRDQYLRESGFDRGIKAWLANGILDYVQRWDVSTADRPDHYIANSRFISERIKRAYNRESTVIYPPVDVEQFTPSARKDDFYLAASRMVPYKKIDLIVDAFACMRDRKLLVIGDGPDYKKIKARAGDNIQFLGYQSSPVLKDYMQRAKAFVFAAKEDFGIMPVEAQACGTPVIAYGRGGVLETVIGLPQQNRDAQIRPTGVFFEEQSVESLKQAVMLFEKNDHKFNGQHVRENAIRFSIDRFRREYKAFVDGKIAEKGLASN